MATCQFVKQLFIQGDTLLPTSSGHEDVATDVLVDNLTICCHTAEGDVHISIKLNGNLVQIWQEFIILHRDIYINVRAWKNWQISLV